MGVWAEAASGVCSRHELEAPRMTCCPRTRHGKEAVELGQEVQPCLHSVNGCISDFGNGRGADSLHLRDLHPTFLCCPR